jgi:hypothetical protein
LNYLNNILINIPVEYRKRSVGNTIKKRIYSPGLLRMILNDPSEAPDSESIRSSINEIFEQLEEKDLGWNI